MSEITSPLKAIKAKCVDCCCGQKQEVKDCPITECDLYPFRLGKNPFRKRELSEEQKAAAAERFKQYHNNKKEITENEQEED